MNQYSSMLCYALATTHELLMTSLPAVAQAWFGPSSTNRIKPTSWQCPTHRRFFFISPAAAFEARAASQIRKRQNLPPSLLDHLVNILQVYTNSIQMMPLPCRSCRTVSFPWSDGQCHLCRSGLRGIWAHLSALNPSIKNSKWWLMVIVAKTAASTVQLAPRPMWQRRSFK